MSTSKWKFFLGLSSNMSVLADITHEARNKSLQLSLNRAGAFSFSLPLSTKNYSYLDPVKYCIICQKNNQYVWSGPIWSKNENLATAEIQLSAVGWFQLLHKRVNETRLTYTSQRRGAIALDLLAQVNNTTQQKETWIGLGSNTDINSVPINQVYEKYTDVGGIIETLSASENGFDFLVDPTNRQLNIKASTDFANRTDVVWGFNWGPKNVGTIEIATDADQMANRIIVIGNGVTGAYQDTTAQNNYQMFTKVLNISEVNNSTLAQAIAVAEIAINATPRVLINFTPKISGPKNVPSLFEDYFIGDKVYITAKRNNFSLNNQAVRVFGTTISFDNNGNESVSSINTTYNSSG